MIRRRQIILLFQLLISTALLLALAIQSGQLSDYLLFNSSWGWTSAHALPLLVVIFLPIWTIFWQWKHWKGFRKWLIIATQLVAVGLYFWFNPLYINDWIDRPEMLSAEDYRANEVVQNLAISDAGFTGLITFVLPHCEFCAELTSRLLELQQRSPQVAQQIHVFDLNRARAVEYSYWTKSQSIPSFAVPSDTSALAFTRGTFPVIVFFKSGQPVRRWDYQSFGYPSLDWIEEQFISGQ